MNKKDTSTSFQNGSNAVEPDCVGHQAEDRCVFLSSNDKILDVGGVMEISETKCLGLKSICNQNITAKIAENDHEMSQTKAETVKPLRNLDDWVDAVPRDPIPALSLPTTLVYGVAPPLSPENNNPLRIVGEATGEKQNLPRTEDIKVYGQDTLRPVRIRGRSRSISLTDTIESDKPLESVSSIPGIKRRGKVKSKKATQRMRPKTSTSLKTSSSDQPFLDLRHILKKHEKKVDKHQSYEESEFRVDFYGSLSSIPFLHPDKEKKKARNGERNQKKKAKSLVSHKSESKDLGKNYENSETTVASDDPATSPVTRNCVDDVDVELWKSMSIQDCNFMEEVSHRPNDMLPLRKNPSPTKNPRTTSIQHDERGCSRLDIGCESGLSMFSSPGRQLWSISAGEMALESKNIPAGTKLKKGKTKDDEPRDTEPEGLSVCRSDILQINENLSDKPATESKLVPRQDDALRSNVCEQTTLLITFPDGCTVSGLFRPNERVQRVIDDLQRDLLRGDMTLPKIDLFANHEDEDATFFDPRAKLTELGLVPSGVVYVRWEKPIAATTSPGWYLRTQN